MKMSIGVKIIAGYLFAIALLFAFGIVSYYSSASLVRASEEENAGFLGIEKMAAIQMQLYNTNAQTRGYMLIGTENYADLELEAANDLNVQIQGLRKFFADSHIEAAELTGMEVNIKDLMDYYREIINLRRDKGIEVSQQLMKDRSAMRNQHMAALNRDIAKLKDIVEKNQKNLEDKAHEVESSQKSMTFYGLAGSMILLIAIGLLITFNISTPLKEVTRVAEELSSGNLSHEITPTGRSDEVGMLTLAFSSMTKRLRQQIQDIKEGVQVLASTSVEISASTSQVTAGASETAAAVTETASTMEELKQVAALTTEKTRVVSDTAQKAVNVAQAGEQSVNETADKMNKIREQMESLATSTIKLSEQSQAIGEIIASVDDIAEQSNLLAVNASIEAAKAGEHGRGFAVVAQEIRNLAKQSKNATGQVRTILNQIQGAISSAVMDTEKGSKAVEAGLEQSVSAGKSIRALVEGIEHAAIAASQISSSIQQQLAGIDQVATAVENIKVASVQNVESMEQVKVAAQNIQKLGGSLSSLVDKYRLS
ncbi:MAG: methyl-accepting chemotaxis protein [Myxococcota bacterium]|jgi:methyl-accepting chemotaxis protein